MVKHTQTIRTQNITFLASELVPFCFEIVLSVCHFFSSNFHVLVGKSNKVNLKVGRAN